MTMNGMDAGSAQGQTPGGNMGEGDPGMPCSSLLMLRRGPLHRLCQLLVIQNSSLYVLMEHSASSGRSKKNEPATILSKALVQ
jgi:hypothetical protein